MLGKIGVWRHVVAVLAVLGIALLAAIGVIGRGSLSEHFESKLITVRPEGADGVRIREVVDQDFGAHDRHGYERVIPTDFGKPTDIEASSPDANADVHTAFVAEGEQIRVGDPGATVSGQHRYILSYTLPQAQLSTRQLALDVVAAGEPLETKRFEVVVTGLTLDDPKCSVGKQGASGGCTLARDGDVYRAVINPLRAGDGITIGGTVTGTTTPVDVADPPLPARRPDHRMMLALATIPLGLIGAGGMYVAARRAGRNEVFAGGAADAAYGSLPAPAGDARADSPVRLVADSRMDELATIEFVPPKGVEPWQGSVLLNERIDRSTVSAWMSGVIARDGLTLTKHDGDLVLARGRAYDGLDDATKALVDELLDHGDALTLGTYNESFASGWNDILSLERDEISTSGWWKRLPPGGGGGGGSAWLILVIFGLFFFGAGSVVVALLGVVRGTVAALIFALLVPAIVARVVYKVMLPARSATGSALALRTESFRRFLAASEGRHVDWAWKQGLLREYSAWAVALGAADAWGRALANSNVPAPEVDLATPMLLYSMGPMFASTATQPTSSGSGGGGSFGGGFSGGSVGGGGGGGSSGSW